jgi:hypothetical protein
MVTKTIEEMEALTPEERVAHFAAEEKIVFGQNFQRDRNGIPVENGVGAPGRESLNHLTALRKYEGEDAYQTAVAAIWKRDPEYAQKLGLKKRGAI